MFWRTVEDSVTDAGIKKNCRIKKPGSKRKREVLHSYQLFKDLHENGALLQYKVTLLPNEKPSWTFKKQIRVRIYFSLQWLGEKSHFNIRVFICVELLLLTTAFKL